MCSSVECLLSTTAYEACVRKAVMLGNDTDICQKLREGQLKQLALYNAASVMRTSTFRQFWVGCLRCRIIALPMSASSTSYAE